MAIKKIVKALILKKGYSFAKKYIIPRAKEEFRKRRNKKQK
ncbi:hypothetical protein [Pseudalkalibacillus decolorationis]|nr:hypothetical protein [Pseudalkalibacillus decolorationis]